MNSKSENYKENLIKKNTDCLFPASFNPIHNGHIEIIRLISLVYHTVYVVVAENENKNYRVPLSKRYQITKDVLHALRFKNVEVLKLEYGETIPKLAKELKITTIVRGTIGGRITDFENILADLYLEENDNLNFHYVSFDDNLITSTMVREQIREHNPIDQFVPKKFAKEIYEIWKEAN